MLTSLEYAGGSDYFWGQKRPFDQKNVFALPTMGLHPQVKIIKIYQKQFKLC